MDQLYDAIEMCFDITNTSDECDFLSSFISCIMCDNDEEELDLMESKDKLFFKEVLHDSNMLRCNFVKVWQCSKSSEVKWKVAEELDWFAFYLFIRRFGWPDLEEENGFLKVALPDSMIRFRKSSKAEELKYKSQLVDLLDSVLLWLSHQPVSAMSVLMYSSAIRLASKAPVTRLHLCIRGCDWLKDNLSKDINDTLWHALQEFLILGVTDMWSRIRDASITRLGPIVEFLQLPQILGLFDELILLCDSNQHQWQINDGAISAISAILKRFQKVGYRASSLQGPFHSKVSSPRIQCHIKIGDVEIDRMPPLLMSRLKVLVLNLIYHPQQTIRDNAIKAFVLCLDRYADHEIDSAFQDVYHRLSSRSNGAAMLGNLVVQTKFNNTRNSSCVDPYGAQSLICLCQHLFKRVQNKINYLENWYHYHCSFDLYLCHPASSVRLVTSNLYKYAISQSISHPLLVKNILYYLDMKWTPDQSILLKNISSINKFIDCQHHKRLSITKREDDKDESSFWEWREGRLLVYELFAKLIIKNHLWYTFGTTEVESVYSSENATSRPTGLANLDTSPNESTLNLCDAGFAMNINKSNDSINNFKLSSSLDRRRMTFTSISFSNLGFRSNIKAISLVNIAINYKDEHKIKRRKSHEISLKKSNHDYFVDKVESIKQAAIAKITTSTSTKNIRSINHSSFLVQVKELEDFDDELINSRSTPSYDSEKKLPTFRTLLSQMFHTSAESLIDPQWELRRMAKQTLPPLGEVLRWFDPGLLVNIISTHLKCEPNLMTSVSLVLLHEALLHTSRLKQLLIRPPSSWQPSVATKIVQQLVMSIETHLPEWIKSCQHYLDRSNVFDCITPVSMNIAITCSSNYTHLVPVLNLSKSVIEVFIRLDKCMKSNTVSAVTISSFDLYPTPSCASSDNPSLDYAVLLLDNLKENLLQWFQRFSLRNSMTDRYDQYKEAILTHARLLPLLSGWIHLISNMRGDCSRYIKDIFKLLNALSRLLFDVMIVDSSTRLVFLEQLSKMMDVFAKYVLCKDIKLNSPWLRQLFDLIFVWLEKFSKIEIDEYLQNGLDKSLFTCILQALLQRLHFSSKNRRATICSLTFSPSLETNYHHKRMSIVENSQAPIIDESHNFIQSQHTNNIELYSSQGVSDNLEYVSDESMNDSDEDAKMTSAYRESHVLNTPRHCKPSSISSSLEYSNTLRLNFNNKKSTSLQIPLRNAKNDIKEVLRMSSTESEDEADGSDWDSTTDSEKSANVKSHVSNDKNISDDSAFIYDLINQVIAFTPNLIDQCKPILSDIDLTILKSLNL